MHKVLFLVLLITSVCLSYTKIYVGCEDKGLADGLNPQNCRNYLDQSLWKSVNEELKKNDVRVVFVAGIYDKGGLILNGIGNTQNHVTIGGEQENTVKFCSDTSSLLRFGGCTNIAVENFDFTGPATGYCFAIGRDKDNIPSSDITVSHCHFYDLPDLFYGCFGSHYGSTNVVLSDCTFKNTGSDIYCHQVYNSYGSKYMHIINCHFEDNAGSYVRYRDGADYGIIAGNTFVSTGRSKNYGKREIFLELSAYSLKENYNEIFATHFWITNNTFKFSEKESDIRYGMRIHHTGFNPEGRKHLMSGEEGEILEGEDSFAKKKLLLENCHIDTDKINFRNNTWINEDWKVGFMSGKGKAPHDGWEGRVDITNLFKFE
ncbi:MAG: hypothetical protein ACIAQZ_04435 [Sedimentisphaeraceae bacterium JB056]